LELAVTSSETKNGFANNLIILSQDLDKFTNDSNMSIFSPNSLIELGVEYVIIGHSERRHLFKEDNKLLNKKISKALDKNLKVIYCVGETLEEREKGNTFKVIQTQLEEGLKDISFSSENLIIAYEPVWAIGTGKAATSEIAQEVHAFIKKVLGKNISVIYGGSVKPSNAKNLITQEDIDGFLV